VRRRKATQLRLSSGHSLPPLRFLTHNASPLRPTAAALSPRRLALGGANGSVVLLEVSPEGVLDGCADVAAELRPALAQRVAGRLRSTLGVAADTAVCALAFARQGQLLFALGGEGTLRAWDLGQHLSSAAAAASRDAHPQPRLILQHQLLPPHALGMQPTLLAAAGSDDSDDVSLVAHVQPPGWAAAGKLLLFGMRVPAAAGGAGAAFGAPAFLAQLEGGVGPRPADVELTHRRLTALWAPPPQGGAVASEEARAPRARLLRWSLDDPSAPAASLLAEQAAEEAAHGACAPQDGGFAAELLEQCCGGALAVDAPVEDRLERLLVGSASRRGAPMARAPLAAALVALGVPPHAVVQAAAAHAPHPLLAAAAEHLRADACRAAGGAQPSAAQLLTAFAVLLRAMAVAWPTCHPALGLLRGDACGLVRAGACSLLYERWRLDAGEVGDRGGQGVASQECRLLALMADDVTASLGGSACAAVDEAMLGGQWAAGTALPLVCRLLRSGGGGAACSPRGDDASRAATKQRNAALRSRQARLRAQLGALSQAGPAAEQLLEALEAAPAQPHPTAFAAAQRAAPLWGASPGAAAACCASAADCAAARLSLARGLLLLTHLAPCALPGTPQGEALRSLQPRALAVTQAALLARFVSTQPAAKAEAGPPQRAPAAFAPPLALAFYHAWRACAHGSDAAGVAPSFDNVGLGARLGAAGALFASFLARGGESTAGGAPPTLRTAVAALGCGLYFQGSAGGGAHPCGPLPALERLLHLAGAATPPCGTTQCAPPALSFLAALAAAGRAHAAAEQPTLRSHHLHAALARFSHAASGVLHPRDEPLSHLLTRLRTLLGAPADGPPELQFFTTLMLFFKRMGAPDAAHAAVQAALAAAQSACGDGAAVGEGTVAMLSANALGFAIECRAWRDAYVALLGREDTHRGDSARRLVGAAVDAGEGGVLLTLPWCSPELAAAVDAALARRAEAAHPVDSPGAAKLLAALRAQRGEHAGSAAVLVAHARRCAQEPGAPAAQARVHALLHASNALLLAAPEERYVMEHLPGVDPACWPPGVGFIPLPPPTPTPHPPNTHLTAAQLGYCDADARDEDNMEEEEAAAAAPESMPDAADAEEALREAATPAAAAHALSMAQRVRVATLGDMSREYALLCAQLELPSDVAALMPRDCTDADADATVGALSARGLFGPAATLACAWHAQAPARRAASLEAVAAAMAARAAACYHSVAAQSELGDPLGRIAGRGGEAGAPALWRALRRLLDAHGRAAPRLKCAAADAALQFSPRAALPAWLVAHFTGAEADAAAPGGGMARRGGADPAELLRIYLRHGCLDDAAQLALSELRRWRSKAGPLERARPAATWMSYGALDALADALAAAGQDAALQQLRDETAAHVAQAKADSTSLVALTSRACLA